MVKTGFEGAPKPYPQKAKEEAVQSNRKKPTTYLKSIEIWFYRDQKPTNKTEITEPQVLQGPGTTNSLNQKY